MVPENLVISAGSIHRVKADEELFSLHPVGGMRMVKTYTHEETTSTAFYVS